MNARAYVIAGLMLASLAARPARAQGELGSEAVRDRLYDMKGRFELTPMLGAQIFDRLTSHDTFTIGAAYNLYSTFAIEARAGFAISGHTGLANQAAQELLQRDPNQGDLALVDDMSDLWEMRGNFIAGVR